MFTKTDRRASRLKRHKRARRHVTGTAERPRLAVYRSLHHIAAQLVDDLAGHTVAAASTHEGDLRKALKSTGGSDAAAAVGRALAARASDKGITAVVFDRGGYQYHGRVKALADAAREAGLEF